jgi:hypothetical protein
MVHLEKGFVSAHRFSDAAKRRETQTASQAAEK